MGNIDLSETQGSSGGITPVILEQLAVLQRRVVLLKGATPEAEVRETPASSLRQRLLCKAWPIRAGT